MCVIVVDGEMEHELLVGLADVWKALQSTVEKCSTKRTEYRNQHGLALAPSNTTTTSYTALDPPNTQLPSQPLPQPDKALLPQTTPALLNSPGAVRENRRGSGVAGLRDGRGSCSSPALPVMVCQWAH